MKKRAFLTALFFGFCTIAMLHSGSKTAAKGIDKTGLEQKTLDAIKADAIIYYKNELNETVGLSDISVPYDSAEVYCADYLDEACTVVTLQVKMPMEEKNVSRYITYRMITKEDGTTGFTVLHEGYERI